MSDISSQVHPGSPSSDNPSDITTQVPPGSTADVSAYAASDISRLAAPRLRLWPGVVLIVLQSLLVGPFLVAPERTIQLVALFLPLQVGMMALFFTPLVGAVAILLWWLLFSRLRWLERPLAVVAFLAFGAAAMALYDPSFRSMGTLRLAVPTVTTAWVVWLLVTTFASWPVRRIGLLIVLLLAWGCYVAVRMDGIYGNMDMHFAWRWTRTAEEKALDEIAARKPMNTTTAEALTLQAGDWSGFRGANRDSRLTGVRIATDWDKNPPKLIWKQRVGPGWASFAVIGDRLYTQEQRAANEVVVCYRADTGTELWSHSDPTRFEEAMAGAGPRATPTFHNGKIYALGAKGRLNCLDAATGQVQWSRDLVADSGAPLPMWGFSSSPLIAQEVVTVFAGGPNGKCVLGYNAASGEPVWEGGEGQFSYCSPQLARLGGVEQVLITTDAGLLAFQPKSGDVLWQHRWLAEGGPAARVVQPTLLDETDVLLGTGMNGGTRRIHVSKTDDGWTEKAVWTSRALKPYYNDQVVYDKHLYGFDGVMFVCVNLEDGKGCWRARGYGNGQVLLLADQGLLLILSETGEVVLVEATADEHKERGRFQALEGKTWNHPVIAHGKLFVRNGEEMACYQLTEDK